mmetsp:Transcript_10003/g.23826  ORF Transcript_10003/g.23826 Transcript_10003/m.23826 type:complete len:250 (+) Transcript_10003:145-894(+)
MKFSLSTAFLLAVAPTALGLQSNYLSDLNGAATSSSPSGNFFQTPTDTMPNMDSMYSSAPTGTNTSPAFVSTPANGSYNAPMAGSSTPSQELLELWSAQVSVELSASQLYLSASIWFRNRGYPGMAAWMLDESDEERGHGFAILEFAMKKGFPVVLEALDAPRNDWTSPIEVWESIIEAEQTNTQNLMRLAHTANGCGDYAAMAFLDPFHEEQLEAEDKVTGILNKVRYADPALMAQLDHDLGEEEEDH